MVVIINEISIDYLFGKNCSISYDIEMGKNCLYKSTDVLEKLHKFYL